MSVDQAPVIPDGALVEAFLQASRVLAAVAVRSLAAGAPDLTLAQHRALVLLGTRGPQRIGDLAALLGVNSSTATRHCDRLQRRDLIERTRPAHDGRGVCVSLTAAGRDTVTRVSDARRRDIRAILHTMPAGERRPLVAALQSFAAAAGEVPEQNWSLGWEQEPPAGAVTLVVTGAAGAGKSTTGTAVAARLGWTFTDADTFHPPANVAKMAAGQPLDDTDRSGWLDSLARWIGERERDGQHCVLACSALRRIHRDRLRAGRDSVLFVHLAVSAATLADRLEHRRGHFMPATLLGDQLAHLEPLQGDEPGFTIDADAPADTVVTRVLTGLPVTGSRAHWCDPTTPRPRDPAPATRRPGQADGTDG